MTNPESIVWHIDAALNVASRIHMPTLRTLENQVWDDIQLGYEIGLYESLEAAQDAFMQWRTKYMLGRTAFNGS